MLCSLAKKENKGTECGKGDQVRQPQSVRGTNISVSHGLGGRWFYCRRSGETTFRGDHLKYDKTLDTVNHCAYIIHSCGAIGHDFRIGPCCSPFEVYSRYINNCLDRLSVVDVF